LCSNPARFEPDTAKIIARCVARALSQRNNPLDFAKPLILFGKDCDALASRATFGISLSNLL
jgi:hypothetical protein